MKNKEKIGVGVITYNRPDYFKKCISNIPFHKIDECIVVKDGGGLDYDINKNDDFHYHEYKENGGNCRSKNKIFEYLLEKGCKHIFLIEDDMLIQIDATILYMGDLWSPQITVYITLSFVVPGSMKNFPPALV